MKLTLRRNKKGASKDNKVIDSSSTQNQSEISVMLKHVDNESNLDPLKQLDKEIVEFNLINKKLPKELIIRIFSYLDIVSLCRCAQVSKVIEILKFDHLGQSG